jgi:hypothetical protein
VESASNQTIVENYMENGPLSTRLFYATERPFKALAVGSTPTELTKPQHLVVFFPSLHNIWFRSTPRRALVEAKAWVERPFLPFSGYFSGTFGPLTLD